jgi:hypothetical protein
MNFHNMQHRSLCKATNVSEASNRPPTEQLRIGHSLTWAINVFATTSGGEKVFMAKWDTKDSFWRLDCELGSGTLPMSYQITAEQAKHSS